MAHLSNELLNTAEHISTVTILISLPFPDSGLDIKENYMNVMWMHLFGDASVWVNVGIGNETTDVKIGTLADLESRGAQTINYQILDTDKIEHEV